MFGDDATIERIPRLVRWRLGPLLSLSNTICSFSLPSRLVPTIVRLCVRSGRALAHAGGRALAHAGGGALHLQAYSVCQSRVKEDRGPTVAWANMMRSCATKSCNPSRALQHHHSRAGRKDTHNVNVSSQGAPKDSQYQECVKQSHVFHYFDCICGNLVAKLLPNKTTSEGQASLTDCHAPVSQAPKDDHVF